MAAKAGIWIDHQQATIVLVSDAGQEIKKVKSGTKPSAPPAGGNAKSYTPNDFVAEDKQQRKAAAEHKHFYDDVIACLGDAKAILVVGPSEAKNEFLKQIKSKKLRGVTVELETAGKMTDRQLAAKVGEYFAGAPASNPAPMKKATKAKKPAKTAKPATKAKK